MVVVSDVHLSPWLDASRASDLAHTLQRFPNREWVLAGDIVDLSVIHERGETSRTVSDWLDGWTPLREALVEHLRRGGRVTWLAGNHDADILRPDVGAALRAWLAPHGGSRFRIEPWCLRRGSVHVEHGHLHDPDNAPVHPLPPGGPESEPLGVALTREFLAPTGALSFAHEHETTPAVGLARAWTRYGRRAPELVARYFFVACAVTLRGHRQARFAAERASGARQLESDGVATWGYPATVLRKLRAQCAIPTHTRPWRTLRRLYLDRAAATTMTLVAGAAAAASATWALPLASAGLSVWVASLASQALWPRRTTQDRLRDAALETATTTGASRVVFGHSHVPELGTTYANAGSFGFAPTGHRPYLLVEGDGRAELRRDGGAPEAANTSYSSARGAEGEPPEQPRKATA